MTYKLNPIIERIQSPVLIITPDGEKRSYISGTEAAADVFDRNYQIASIKAENGTVVITLSEPQVAGMNWIGEEQSLFDG